MKGWNGREDTSSPVAPNFAFMRTVLAILSMALCMRSWAQPATPADPGVALTYERSVAVGLTMAQLHDHALEAWTWTFGTQPGGRILGMDRSAGTIDATARFNFRSTMLTMREETTGVVEYKVSIRMSSGSCRVEVSELTHTGDRGTTLGGVHAGVLMKEPGGGRIRGMSRAHAVQLRKELAEASDRHIGAMLDAFFARLLANMEE